MYHSSNGSKDKSGDAVVQGANNAVKNLSSTTQPKEKWAGTKVGELYQAFYQGGKPLDDLWVTTTDVIGKTLAKKPNSKSETVYLTDWFENPTSKRKKIVSRQTLFKGSYIYFIPKDDKGKVIGDPIKLVRVDYTLDIMPDGSFRPMYNTSDTFRYSTNKPAYFLYAEVAPAYETILKNPKGYSEFSIAKAKERVEKNADALASKFMGDYDYSNYRGKASQSTASGVKVYQTLREATKYKVSGSAGNYQVVEFFNSTPIAKDTYIKGTPVIIVDDGKPYPLVKVLNENYYIKKSDLNTISGFDGEYDNAYGNYKDPRYNYTPNVPSRFTGLDDIRTDMNKYGAEGFITDMGADGYYYSEGMDMELSNMDALDESIANAIGVDLDLGADGRQGNQNNFKVVARKEAPKIVNDKGSWIRKGSFNKGEIKTVVSKDRITFFCPMRNENVTRNLYIFSDGTASVPPQWNRYSNADGYNAYSEDVSDFAKSSAPNQACETKKTNDIKECDNNYTFNMSNPATAGTAYNTYKLCVNSALATYNKCMGKSNFDGDLDFDADYSNLTNESLLDGLTENTSMLEFMGGDEYVNNGFADTLKGVVFQFASGVVYYRSGVLPPNTVKRVKRIFTSAVFKQGVDYNTLGSPKELRRLIEFTDKTVGLLSQWKKVSDLQSTNFEGDYSNFIPQAINVFLLKDKLSNWWSSLDDGDLEDVKDNLGGNARAYRDKNTGKINKVAKDLGGEKVVEFTLVDIPTKDGKKTVGRAALYQVRPDRKGSMLINDGSWKNGGKEIVLSATQRILDEDNATQNVLSMAEELELVAFRNMVEKRANAIREKQKQSTTKRKCSYFFTKDGFVYDTKGKDGRLFKKYAKKNKEWAGIILNPKQYTTIENVKYVLSENSKGEKIYLKENEIRIFCVGDGGGSVSNKTRTTSTNSSSTSKPTRTTRTLGLDSVLEFEVIKTTPRLIAETLKGDRSTEYKFYKYDDIKKGERIIIPFNSKDISPKEILNIFDKMVYKGNKLMLLDEDTNVVTPYKNVKYIGSKVTPLAPSYEGMYAIKSNYKKIDLDKAVIDLSDKSFFEGDYSNLTDQSLLDGLTENTSLLEFEGGYSNYEGLGNVVNYKEVPYYKNYGNYYKKSGFYPTKTIKRVVQVANVRVVLDDKSIVKMNILIFDDKTAGLPNDWESYSSMNGDYYNTSGVVDPATAVLNKIGDSQVVDGATADAEFEKSGAKKEGKSFKDWFRSDKGRNVLNILAQVGLNLLDGGKPKNKPKDDKPSTDEIVRVDEGGGVVINNPDLSSDPNKPKEETKILGMSPVVFGVVALSVIAIGTIVTIKVMKAKKP